MKFRVYVVTVHSRTSAERSAEPVGTIDAGDGRGVSEALRRRAHKLFELKPNQYATFLSAKSGKEHKERGQ